MARCNKCGSGLAPRSAARAALDLKGAEDLEVSTSRCAARAALDLMGAEDLKASTSRSAARAALDLQPTTPLKLTLTLKPVSKHFRTS